jgi:hypothetical protein
MEHPNTFNTQAYNIVTNDTVSSSISYVTPVTSLPYEARLHSIIVNAASGSANTHSVSIYDGYKSSSISMSIDTNVTTSHTLWAFAASSGLVGTINLSGVNNGTVIPYNLVCKQGIAIKTYPSGTKDITIIFEG